MPSVTIDAGVELVVDRPPLSILIVDDDRAYAESSLGRIAGISSLPDVTVAHSLQAATELLENRTFDVIWADQRFGNVKPGGGDATGESWLLTHAERLAAATRRVIVTGFPNDIHNRQQLEKQGVKVIVKASADEDNLFEDIKALASHSLSTIGLQAARKLKKDAGEAPVASLDDDVQALFLDWLGTRKNPDAKEILIGRRTLSINNVVQEVQDGTDFGRLIQKIFLGELRRRLGMSRGV